MIDISNQNFLVSYDVMTCINYNKLGQFIVNKDKYILLRDEFCEMFRYKNEEMYDKIKNYFDKIESLFEFLSKKIDFTTSEAKTLFTNVGGQDEYSVFGQLFFLPDENMSSEARAIMGLYEKSKVQTTDEKISRLKKILHDFGDKSEKIEDNIIETDADIISFLSKVDIPDEKKYLFISIYFRYDYYFKFYAEYMVLIEKYWIKWILLDSENDLLSFAESEMRKFEEKLRTHGVEKYFFESIGLKIKAGTSPHFFPVIIMPNVLYSKSNEVKYIAYGFLVHAILDILASKKMTDKDAQSVFKLFSDNTKFSIVKLLSKEKLYAAQIAEKLGLTSATISYHMNDLVNNHYVTIEPHDNKVFYSILLDRISEDIKSALDCLLS